MANTTYTETNSDLWTWSTLAIMVFCSILISPLVIAVMGAFTEITLVSSLTAFGATVFTMALIKIGIQVARG